MLGFLRNLLGKDFSRWNGGHCSAFFDRVWGVEIGDICYDHDAAYEAGTILLKIKGDRDFFQALIRRSLQQKSWKKPVMIFTSLCMTMAVITVGWLFWLRTRYKTE